jgi:HAD superfamily hydrolase (TIGR01509 family)
MDWIHQYQLFLFDFDGLLVNTEELHYLAYKRMCRGRGLELAWNFDKYCKIAHYTAEGIRDTMYAEMPELYQMEPNWDVLYAEKKQAILDLLNEGAVHTMPGVDPLLLALKQAGIARCVVTHSPTQIIEIVRKKNPVLDTIPFWITREDYTHPKPHPECYFKAIALHAKSGDKIIGFEDTPRGMKALLGTGKVDPVLICTIDYPEISEFRDLGVRIFPSFSAFQ